MCGRKIFLHIKEICAAFKNNNKRCMWEIRDERKKTGTKRRGENFLSCHFTFLKTAARVKCTATECHMGSTDERLQ